MISLLPKHNPRFYELDLMRFIAAMAVVIHHFTVSMPYFFALPGYSINHITRYGYLGVDAFFMISGYVVLMSSAHKPPKEFLVSRAVRLYPAYWFTCILTFLALFFGKIDTQLAPKVSFSLFAYNLTMLQELFGKANLNGVFWSLTFEVSFYFIIILISALKLWKHLLVVILVWLIYSFAAGANATNNAFAFLLIPKYSCNFIAGMLFYLLRIKFAANWKIYCLLIMCYSLNIKNVISIRDDVNIFFNGVYFCENYVVIGFISFFYVFLLLSALNKLKFLQLEFFARLGELTYPLYLIHGFGIGAFILLSGQVNKYLLLLFVTLLMLFLAWLVFRCIEKTTRRPFTTVLNRLFYSV